MTQPQPGWLDDEPVETVAPKKRRKRKAKKTRAKKVKIESSTKLPQEVARRFGPGRIWGCDGEFIMFRPKRMIDGVFTQVANPAAMERHERFVRLGHYVYVATFDDVQVFRVTEHSPLKRKFGSLMEMKTEDVKRAVIMSAVKREWQVYVDALEELAHRIKSRRFGDGQAGGQLAANQWAEMLAYIDLQILMRRGPAPEECARELGRIQSLRRGGSGDGKRILIT